MHTFTFGERFAAARNLLPVALYDVFPAVLLGRALVTAHALGVFEAFGDGGRGERTIGELSSALTLPARSLHLLLPPLSAAGYLRETGDGTFALTPQSRKWLVHSSPHSIGNFLAYIGLLHDRWALLEQSIRAGRPVSPYVQSFTDREWTIYTLGMMDLARLLMPYVLPQLRLPTAAGRARGTGLSLLDYCGSHGLYSIELCRRYPELTATVADFPQVLRTTAEIVGRARLQKRIRLLPGDATTLPPGDAGGTYDAILAFNIIHGFSADQNARILSTLASLLEGGGSIFILDQLRDPRSSGSGRLLPLIVGLNLLNESGGGVYTFGEIKAWCGAAGLSHVRVRRLAVPGVHLVEARKS